MTKRHELQRQRASLDNIGELMGAMKNIALLECRRIAAFIEAQTTATTIIESAFADFAHDHATELPTDPPGHEVLLLIGSERGLCGDLNPRLADHAAALASPVQRQVVLVGSRLADRWNGPFAASVPGAQFAEEVQSVLLNLLATLVPLLDRRDGTPAVLRLIYLGESGAVERQLLPVPQITAQTVRRGHAVLLYLPPRDYLKVLLQQWLAAAVGSALYDALLYENQMRLEHMEQARQRINDRLAVLDSQSNMARQEEITQEIELIQLSASMDNFR